jgi:hypothetical protein
VEGSCEHGNEPSGSIKFGKFLSGCTVGGFSRRAQLPEFSVRILVQISRIVIFMILFRLTRQMSCSLVVLIRRIKMRLLTTAYVTHYT